VVNLILKKKMGDSRSTTFQFKVYLIFKFWFTSLQSVKAMVVNPEKKWVILGAPLFYSRLT
jgi:hypothetical protein